MFYAGVWPIEGYEATMSMVGARKLYDFGKPGSKLPIFFCISFKLDQGVKKEEEWFVVFG